MFMSPVLTTMASRSSPVVWSAHTAYDHRHPSLGSTPNVPSDPGHLDNPQDMAALAGQERESPLSHAVTHHEDTGYQRSRPDRVPDGASENPNATTCRKHSPMPDA